MTSWQAVDILGENRNRHDRIWFVHWRPQIEALMSGPEENYIAGLMLIVPCMERVYTLRHPKWDIYKQRKTGGKEKQVPVGEVLKEFFRNENPAEYDEIIKVVAKGLANGLKHDSFVRDEIFLYDKNVARVKSGNTGDTVDSAWFVRRTQAIVSMENGCVAIAPRSFWHVVRRQIDKFYLEEYSSGN